MRSGICILLSLFTCLHAASLLFAAQKLSYSIPYLQSLKKRQIEDIFEEAQQLGFETDVIQQFKDAGILTKFPEVFKAPSEAGKGAGLGEGKGPGLGEGKGPGLGEGKGAGLGEGLGAGKGAGAGEGKGAGLGGEKPGEMPQPLARPVIEQPSEEKPGQLPTEKKEEIKEKPIKKEALLIDIIVPSPKSVTSEQQKKSDEWLANVIEELSYKLFDTPQSIGDGELKKQFNTLLDTYLYFIKYSLASKLGKNTAFAKGDELKALLASQQDKPSPFDEFMIQHMIKKEEPLHELLMALYNECSSSQKLTQLFADLLKPLVFDVTVLKDIEPSLKTLLINSGVQQRVFNTSPAAPDQILSDARVLEVLKKLKDAIRQDPLIMEYEQELSAYPKQVQQFEVLERVYLQGAQLRQNLLGAQKKAEKDKKELAELQKQATEAQQKSLAVDQTKLSIAETAADESDKELKSQELNYTMFVDTFNNAKIAYFKLLDPNLSEDEEKARQGLELPEKPIRAELPVDQYLQKDYLADFARELNCLRLNPEFLKYQGLIGPVETAQESGAGAFLAATKKPLLNLLQGPLLPKSFMQKVRTSLLFNPDAFETVFEESSPLLAKAEKTHNFMQLKQKPTIEVDPAQLVTQLVAKAATVGDLIKLSSNATLANALPENKKSVLRELRDILLDANSDTPDENAVITMVKKLRKDANEFLDADVEKRIRTILAEYKNYKKVLIEARERKKSERYVGAFLADKLRAIKFTTDKSLNTRLEVLYKLERMPKSVRDNLQAIIGDATLFKAITQATPEEFYTWIEPYGLITGILKSFAEDVRHDDSVQQQIALMFDSLLCINEGKKLKESVVPFIPQNESALKLGTGLFGTIIKAMTEGDLKKARDEINNLLNTWQAKNKMGVLWTTTKTCKDLIAHALDKLIYPMMANIVDQISALDGGKGTVEIPGLSLTKGSYEELARNALIYKQMMGIFTPWADLGGSGGAKLSTLSDAQIVEYIQKLSTPNLKTAIATILASLQNKLKAVKPTPITNFDEVQLKNFLENIVARIGYLQDYVQTKAGIMPIKTEGIMPPPPPPPSLGGNPPPPPPPPPMKM